MLHVWVIKNDKNEINLNTFGATDRDAMLKWLTINSLYDYAEGDGDFRIRDAFFSVNKKHGVSIAKLAVHEIKA